MQLVKFYEVEFTNALGQSTYEKVVGTDEQVNDWAIKEASANGFAYNVTYLCTDTLDGIKNLANN